VRSCLRVCVLAAVVAACGGESRFHQDVPVPAASAGAPGVGGAASDEWTLPTKDGIPIGDCTEPSPSELMRDGCPVSQSNGVACAEAQEGAVCQYAIVTDAEGMSAFQNYTVCLDGRWIPGGRRCAETCHSSVTDSTITRFDTSDCATRTELLCPPSDATIVPQPSAQDEMDHEIEELLRTCEMTQRVGVGAEIDFEDGCPSALVTSSSLDPSILACLMSGLSVARYVCAVPLPCAIFTPLAI